MTLLPFAERLAAVLSLGEPSIAATTMQFHRGKIADVTVGPRWRVKHAADKDPPPTTGMVDIVGAADERRRRPWCRPPIAERASSSAPKRLD
jgi:hypothetical protein